MMLPDDADLLGTAPPRLVIGCRGANTLLELGADSLRRLRPHLAAASRQAPAPRVYLALHDIRGTHDACVLGVYVNLPPDAPPGEHPRLRAGSTALFGLRMASTRSSDSSGEGMTCFFDVTRVLADLSADSPLDCLRISIVPNRPLPEGASLIIGGIALYLHLA